MSVSVLDQTSAVVHEITEQLLGVTIAGFFKAF